MIEQVEKRTRNSKTFLRSDGKFELRSRSVPIHFVSNGRWEDIDNRVITSQAQGYYLENGLNEFKVYFKQNLNSNGAIRFEKDNASVDVTVKGICLYDESTDNYFQFRLPNNSNDPVVEGRKIIYTGVYPGVNFGFILLPTGIKEYVEVLDRSEIPDPLSLGLDPATTFVALITEYSYSCDSAEDEFGPIGSRERELGVIKFVSNGEEKFYSPELYGFDNNPLHRQNKMKKRGKRNGKKITMYHGVLYASIFAADLPYIIDTNLNVYITAGSDDCFESDNATIFLTDDHLSVGNESSKSEIPYDIGLRYLNITVPQGTSVTSAKITYVTLNSCSSLTTVIKGVDVDDFSSTWSSGNRPSQQTKTTAQVNMTINSPSGYNTYDTPDISTIVDEIFGRASWASGNDLAIVVEDNYTGSTKLSYWASYEHATQNPTELVIVYGASGTVYTFTSDMKGDSLASAPSVEVLRKITSDMKGDTLITSPSLSLIYSFVSAMSGDTLITSPSIDIVTKFISSMSGDSLIATPSLDVLRSIASSISGDSLTTGNLEVLRLMTSSMKGDTLITSPELLSLVSFVSSMKGDSLITSPSVEVLRKIITSATGESLTSDAALEVLRSIATSMSGDTLITSPTLYIVVLGTILDPSLENTTPILAIGNITSELSIGNITSDVTIEDITSAITITKKTS